MSTSKRLITLLLLLQINKNTLAFDCSLTSCACSESANAGYDIHCPDFDNSIVTISFDFLSIKALEINCKNNNNYVNFLPSTYLSPDIQNVSLTSLRFIACSLPENVTVRDVMNKLRIEKTEKLRIKNSDLRNVTRKDLDGLQNLTELEVLSNTVTDIPSDLFYDLKKLTSIDMRGNEIVIPQEIFHECLNLNYIELAENFLPKNTTGLFKNLNKLKTLNMWRMHITNLDEDIYTNLINLENLELSLNSITELPEHIFGHLRRLKQLSLNRNSLISLHANIFKNNTMLEFLNLRENSLSSLPENLLANKKLLTEVILSHCDLTTIPSNLFNNSNKLQSLDLSFNRIESLSDDLLKQKNELKVLKLEGNMLTHLSKEFFEDLIQLEELNLNENYLILTPDNFETLGELKSLSIASNNIEKMDHIMFRNMGKLLKLDLSYNKLTFMEDITKTAFGIYSIMDDLLNLEELYLKSNNISHMFADWKISKTHLKKLDLSNNTFTKLKAFDLDFKQNNIEINLENNEITDINLRDMEKQIIDSLPFEDKYAVQSYRRDRRELTVKLNNNPLHCSCNLYDLYRYFDLSIAPELRDFLNIEADQLYCSSSSPIENAGKLVKELKSKNSVCIIHNEICPNGATCYWKPYGEILTIDLAYNNLTNVPELTSLKKKENYRFEKYVVLLQANNLKEMPRPGMGYEHIHALDLSYNHIDNISWVPENLETLSLHNNSLSHLDEEALAQFNSSHLKNLSLFNNPWECNCSTINFLKFIQEKFAMLSNIQKITCQSTNQQIVDLSVDDLCPLNTTLIIFLCVIVTLMSLTTAILAGLYYRYNMEIKVWLFAHQQCLWLVTEEEVDKDKLYDAFISYSHKDEDFIIAELINNLEEGPRPYKLCLHFRNWQPGEFITKNIATSVAESRRTIVVLSPNFLESEWGRMEFRTAHKQALEENRARVIIILLGDIPMDNLDDEIKAYLSTNTYLKWGDPWFWDKLKYALPHTPKFVKAYQSLERVRIDSDKFDLINELPSPPIQTTPPVDKLVFDPMKNGILNVKLINGTLVNEGCNDMVKTKNFINS